MALRAEPLTSNYGYVISAQAPLLRDRRSDQPLPPHLVGFERLRSFSALMTQDIGSHHGNSQRTGSSKEKFCLRREEREL